MNKSYDRVLTSPTPEGAPSSASNSQPTAVEEVSTPLRSMDGRCHVELSIISNSPLLREGLVSLLAQHLDLVLIGSYNAQTEPYLLPANPSGHIVLLDGSMNAATLVRWIHYWRAMAPPTHVIIIHMRDEDDLILACMEAGVSAYALQGAAISSLIALLALARQGQIYCMPDKALQLAATLARPRARSPRPQEPPPILTARELEILGYLAEDRTNKEIADLIIIEIGTVKHHVHRILEKLNVRHRWEAARLAVEEGWIPLQHPSRRDQETEEAQVTRGETAAGGSGGRRTWL